MIRQTDNKLPLAINKWGCYFMSILYHSGRKNGKNYGSDEIMAIYRAAIMTGIISKEVYDNGVLVDGCTVQDPVSLFALCGVTRKSVENVNFDHVANPGEIEILVFHRDADIPKGSGNDAHTHFVAGQDGLVLWDPIQNSNTVKYGNIVSKRIFA